MRYAVLFEHRIELLRGAVDFGCRQEYYSYAVHYLRSDLADGVGNFELLPESGILDGYEAAVAIRLQTRLRRADEVTGSPANDGCLFVHLALRS